MALLLTVDFGASAPPVYAQLVEQIEQQVRSGALRPGDQLPTVRQLAAQLRINFNTVARAYRLLDQAGLISTQQGRGTYIVSTPDAQTAQQLRRERLIGLLQQCVSEARRLGMDAQELRALFERQLQDWEDGEPPSPPRPA